MAAKAEAKTPEPKFEPKIEFEMLTGKITPRLTILVHGPTKTGKTWFALSAPGELGIISNDANTKQIANKYVLEHPGTKIHYCEFLKSPLSRIDDINVLKKFWISYRDAYYRLLEIPAVRTVIVDTHTIAYEDCKLAYIGKNVPDSSSVVNDKGEATGTRIIAEKIIKVGGQMKKDYSEPNRDIREMVNAAGDKNLVLICHSDDDYQNDVKTGKLRPKSMKGLEYLSQVAIETSREKTTGTFIARMNSSTANSDIRGREGALVFKGKLGKDVWEPSADELTNEDVNFAMVGITVFPQTELTDWE